MQIHIRLPFTAYGELNITGESLDSIIPSLDWLAARGLIPQPSAVVTGEAPTPAAVRDAEVAAPVEEKPKTIRAKKETPKKDDAPKLTIADVTSAVTVLAGKKGVAVARELITSFGVGKASEVPQEKWADFIAKAKALTDAEEEVAEEELPL